MTKTGGNGGKIRVRQTSNGGLLIKIPRSPPQTSANTVSDDPHHLTSWRPNIVFLQIVVVPKFVWGGFVSRFWGAVNFGRSQQLPRVILLWMHLLRPLRRDRRIHRGDHVDILRATYWDWNFLFQIGIKALTPNRLEFGRLICVIWDICYDLGKFGRLESIQS